MYEDQSPSIAPKPVLGSPGPKTDLSSQTLELEQNDRGLAEVTQTYPNGDRYDGELYIPSSTEGSLKAPNGIKWGHGKYTFANGSFYEGRWRKGMMHGHGVFIDAATGDRYEGQWCKGKRTTGSYYYGGEGNRQYHGSFASDGLSKEGRAIIWEDGVMFEAMYESDVLLWQREFKTTPQPIRFVPSSPATSSSPGRKAQQQLFHSTEDGNENDETQNNAERSGKQGDTPPMPSTNDTRDITRTLLSTGDGRPLSTRQLNAALSLFKQQRKGTSGNTCRPLGGSRQEVRDAVGGTLLIAKESKQFGAVPKKQLQDAMRFYR